MSRSTTGAAVLAILLLAGCGARSEPGQVVDGSGGTAAAPSPQQDARRPSPPRLVESGSGNLSPFASGDEEIDALDPALRSALQAAAHAASDAGVDFWVTSGWRSRSHQQRLLDEAVARYGSLAEALRYVSTPDTSAHVTGDAVDIGPAAADAWLEEHGATWGLCRMFANEIWHFELATEPGGTCPAMLPDSSHR